MKRPVRDSSLGEVLFAIRREATQVRGATYGSMYRNDVYHFARAGTFLERADNTARILDVKYYLLLPSYSYVGSTLDTGQWESILRSLSARRAHRWISSVGKMDARGIAGLLILDECFPRSLAYCYDALSSNLAELEKMYDEESQCNRLISEAEDKLGATTIETVFEQGLHEFLVEFISANQAIANAIAKDYRFNT
jgi:uncharacterized alpha-E superfamily protein